MQIIAKMDRTQLTEFECKFSVSSPLMSEKRKTLIKNAIENRREELRNTFDFMAEGGEIKEGEL